MPSETSLGPQHQCPGNVSAGGPQDKDPEKLWTKVVGAGEQSDIGRVNCELRGCQGASGNLVQQQGRGLGRWGARRSVGDGGRRT